MVDILTRKQRSAMMSRIRGKDTEPEFVVRRLAHSLGFRFRLHRRDLPGSPDLVFPRLKKAIFVHGCFWHRHCCGRAYNPKTRPEFWAQKFSENLRRDKRARLELRRAGWKVLLVWECETFSAERLLPRLLRFLRTSDEA
jgi:DNA mismatch endonuclease (patch repair protein)